MDSLTKVVEILSPLSSEERIRVIRAAMVLLGEAVPPAGFTLDEPTGSLEGLSARARLWMKQNSLTVEQLQQVFHLLEGAVEIIAPQLPGKNKKEQTYSAYILTGVGQFLLTGNASFDDKAARALCESSGCYDLANHSAILRDRGNEFAGSKDKGWTLTTPGLRRGAELVKEMQIAS